MNARPTTRHALAWAAAAALALSSAAVLPAADAKKADKPAAAAPADTMAELDAALAEAAGFKYGSPDAPLKKAEEIVVGSAKSKDRDAVERRLLALLASDKATRDAKEFACRQLFFVGGKASVGPLAGLLEDKDLAHVARYTLGRMAVALPEAGAALRAALGTTVGDLQAGVVNTLGDLRDNAAVRELQQLALAGDTNVTAAAIAALGKIGTPDAAKALESVRGQASAQSRPLVAHALLTAADHLCAANKPDDAAAAAIYEKLYASAERPVKIGALRGLVLTRGVAASDQLVDTIKGSDATAARQAIGFTRELKGEALSKTLVGLIPALAPERQEVLIRALSVRGDATATAAILEATKSDKAPPRVAALDVLGEIGDASAVDLLAAAAAKGGDDQRAARESLVRLKGDKTTDAVAAGIAKATEPKLRAEYVRAFARRAPDGAAFLFLIAKNDPDAGVRREAITGLGSLVKGDELKALVDLAVTPRDAGDRGAFEEALATAVRRSGDPKRATDLVSAAVGSATGETKASLVRLYKAAASPEALAALRPLTADSEKPVADAATRTLADWPDQAAADDLLRIAKSTENKTHKVLALRGYIRLAGQDQDRQRDKALAMYKSAAAVVERPDERRMILSGLGNLATPDALAMARSYLTDDGAAAEAGQAVIQIVTRSRDKAVTAKAKDALAQVIAGTKDAKVKKAAEDAQAELAKKKG